MRFTIAFSTALVVLAVSIAMGCVIGYGIVLHLKKMRAEFTSRQLPPISWTRSRWLEHDRETQRRRDP